MGAYASCDYYLVSVTQSTSRNGQTMRPEIPVFGDYEKKLAGHESKPPGSLILFVIHGQRLSPFCNSTSRLRIRTGLPQDSLAEIPPFEYMLFSLGVRDVPSTWEM